MKKKESKLWAVLALILTVILCLIIGSCKTVYVPVVEEHTRDSVRIEQRVDTFLQVKTDSIVVQLPCNDSIEVAYVDRWHTETTYKTTELIHQESVDKVDKEPQIVEVEKIVTQNSKMANFALWYMWISIAVIVMVIALKIYKKVHTL